MLKPRDVAAVTELTAMLGRWLGLEQQAEQLITELDQAWHTAEQNLGRMQRRVLALTWRDPWLAVGSESYAADLLRMCGAENCALRLPGKSPRASLDLLLRSNPEVILLAQGPYPFREEDLGVFWRFGDVEAIRQGRVHIIDGRIFSRWGVRTPYALAALHAIIYSR